MKPSIRIEKMKGLDFFNGTWTVEVTHPHLQPTPIMGHTRFEWLNESYIIQYTHIDKAEFPSSTIVYDWDPQRNHYLQHYFDSRGVTRLYQMSLEEGIWKLWRDTADFSPLHFFQRFTGEIDESGNKIESSWEQSDDGINWAHDFKVLYRRN